MLAKENLWMVPEAGRGRKQYGTGRNKGRSLTRLPDTLKGYRDPLEQPLWTRMARTYTQALIRHRGRLPEVSTLLQRRLSDVYLKTALASLGTFSPFLKMKPRSTAQCFGPCPLSVHTLVLLYFRIVYESNAPQITELLEFSKSNIFFFIQKTKVHLENTQLNEGDF